jgi:hypothetical protein
MYVINAFVNLPAIAFGTGSATQGFNREAQPGFLRWGFNSDLALKRTGPQQCKPTY